MAGPCPVDLRVEQAVEPLGVDEPHPELSWRLQAPAGDRGVRQSAYQVHVLDGETVHWDSGRRDGDELTLEYAGPPLAARSRYRWRVRVWDGEGAESPWSAPSWFEMALAPDEDWGASWIGGVPVPEDDVDLFGVRRISAEGPAGCFRRAFEVPPGCRVAGARLRAAAAHLTAYCNGQEVGAGEGELDLDVGELLRTGPNVLAIRAQGALLAALQVTSSTDPGARPRAVTSGSFQVTTDTSWLASPEAPPGWHATEFDDREWRRAADAGRYGDPPEGRHPQTGRPCSLLRRAFEVPDQARSARLYVTALGVYRCWLNGAPVSDDVLAPGWTDYPTRLEYQVYDVTGLLRAGENVLAAELGEGWYSGWVGSQGPQRYGRRPKLLARLEVTDEHGRQTTLGTDERWRAATGERQYADLLMGETVDARLRRDGWTEPGFDDRDWAPVEAGPERHGRLVARAGPRMAVQQEVHPVSVREAGPRRWIYDVGQNLVGWVRLRARGERGTKVVVRHAEALLPDGELYLTNLRGAQAVDELVLAGTGEPEVFEPHFTSHGFRYVEVSGLAEAPGLDDLTACVVHADMPRVGGFACSNPELTQLQQNIEWGQRGNFLAVPTDCPQRDERLGWTGDAQVFCATALFSLATRRFFRRWLLDVMDAQAPSGAVPDVVPAPPGWPGYGAAGWGDAITVVPWTLLDRCGDVRTAGRLLPAVRRWLEFLEGESDGLIRPAEGYGDWLSLDAETPKDLIGTAYFAHSCRLAAELAAAAGDTGLAQHAGALREGVRTAFRRRFVAGSGQVAGDTQTAYVLALQAGLLDPDEVPAAAARLVRRLEQRGHHLSTGFLGTPWLLDALTQAGHRDEAFRLLLQDTFPSWLYQVRSGATTMWERWDTWTDAKGFSTSYTTEGRRTIEMNSLNHYAYGAVGDWMYREIGALESAAPGYRHVRVHPRPAGGITWARTYHEAPAGRVAVEWEVEPDGLRVAVEVPPNAAATVVLDATPDRIREGGRQLGEAPGVEDVSPGPGRTEVEIGSGEYRFEVDGGVE